ncbi:murein transglycosylase A [Thorsellia kenyensis]|uniref:peptidoglycan lytic exotransglycosylase n=1 Tax=Thorsellia kenyensis TaxID=1549888 RepID=A0ABV6CA18_9GAMM
MIFFTSPLSFNRAKKTALNKLRYFNICTTVLALFVLVGCTSKKEITPVIREAYDLSINKSAFFEQLSTIEQNSSKLITQNNKLYQCTKAWVDAGADEARLAEFGLMLNKPFVTEANQALFTGYYSPVIKGRRTAQGDFIYPILSKPNLTKGNMPSRSEIHDGALDGMGLELAYTQSRVDNFIMGVQGSGFIDFEDGNPPVYFGYSGQNGHKFKGIGKYLVEQGELTKENVSLKTIYEWIEQHSEEEVLELLNQNPSWVFFAPKNNDHVKGAAGIPLVAHGSVAADKSIFDMGDLIYAKVPHVDNAGNFTGKYKPRVYVALDVGGAIKNNHFDIYHGLGEKAGYEAGNNKYNGNAYQLVLNENGEFCQSY